MSWSFLSPDRLWWLLAVAAMAVAYVLLQFRTKTYAIRFSNLDLLDKVAPKRPGWRRHVIAGVYLLALASLVVAMAQPLATERVPKERATIILAIDTSLSMQATDVSPTRIDSAKVAAQKFVTSLPEKLQLGLVTFNGNTRLMVPPSTDRSSVTRAIQSLQLDEGTAIGDAVKTSLDAIAAVPEDESGKKAPAVIVLLSDGKTTVGTPTEDAIEPATSAKVPVFTIAYGTPDGVVEVTDPASGVSQQVSVPVDEEALAQLAEGTGGEAFTAASESDLTSVYAKLGSAIGYDEEEREVTWKVLAGGLAALGLVGGLSLAWFQRLP
ncbi:MAG: VWA domain-containing protein [Microthrixaceae bacterium]|nr:VWA domain-containing protein [Microthrixaceae bacterium]